jgi:hypothetical protein
MKRFKLCQRLPEPDDDDDNDNDTIDHPGVPT